MVLLVLLILVLLSSNRDCTTLENELELLKYKAFIGHIHNNNTYCTIILFKRKNNY